MSNSQADSTTDQSLYPLNLLMEARETEAFFKLLSSLLFESPLSGRLPLASCPADNILSRRTVDFMSLTCAH